MTKPYEILDLLYEGVPSELCDVNGDLDTNPKKLQKIAVMQYTGLNDKNGKEIYEGDIVEWKYLQTWHKNEVMWVGGGFVVTTSGFKDDLNEPQDLSLVSILNCEIIGNIYENPELLKTND